MVAWIYWINNLKKKQHPPPQSLLLRLRFSVSSLLAFGNIRKFEPHFHDFFLVSKKNQRLKNSVLNAIELLKNNNEDISYFDKKTLARKIKKEPRTEGTPVKQNIKMVEQQMPQFNIIEPKIGVENVEKRKRGRPKKIVKQ